MEEIVASGQIRQLHRQRLRRARSTTATSCACEAWSGDVIAMQYDNKDIKFVAPTEGLSLWSDNMLVPNKADHKANAEQLMNYYYDPEVAARLAAWVNYICPVAGAEEAMAKIDDSLVGNPLIFPTRRGPRVHLGDDAASTARPASSTTRTSPESSERDRVSEGSDRSTNSDLVLSGVTKRFGSFVAVDDLDLTVPSGLLLRAARPVGLRQDHDPADDRRPRGAHRRRDHARRRTTSPASSPTSARSTPSSRATRCSRT